MTTIEQRVAAGAAWLDITRPSWIDEIDLDQLQLSQCEQCVLGQIVGYEAEQAPFYDATCRDDSYESSEDLQGFDAVVGDISLATADVLEHVDSLIDLRMTIEESVERGFHLGQPAFHGESGEWLELTNEWKRVILIRRAVASGKTEGEA